MSVSRNARWGAGVVLLVAVAVGGAGLAFAPLVRGRLAAEAPFWKPGTRNGYHGVTSAWTVGEMVHRSTGKRMGRFLADEIVGPLGIEFWMGLPQEQMYRWEGQAKSKVREA